MTKPEKDEQTHVTASIPLHNAADLALQAAKAGIPVEKFHGVMLLRGAYGPFHPDVLTFSMAQTGTGKGG